ncbi:hypothetical protein jhhlp_001940 [Lomentospora prolificans]|uniref:Glycosyl transferase CAP10 domain-containing protein n=1 Tax=Lomentospora prolificans TaxID=41688 RepID=A0A2N3NCM4_9PEZI|nr:hypothetical protein jhhlp_001940 [Lomentospora prolificans]
MLTPRSLPRRGLGLVLVFVFIFCAAYQVIQILPTTLGFQEDVPSDKRERPQIPIWNAEESPTPEASQSTQEVQHERIEEPEQPKPEAPQPAEGAGPQDVVDESESHPILQLVQKANDEREATISRQSKSLTEAVAEYRRRYGLPPPPNFDKWYEFAKERDVVLIDEFDMIHEMLAPFWGLRPATIRKRAAEALGYSNSLIGILIRDHKVSLHQGGKTWEKKALGQMFSNITNYLPDMDLAFNALDEPRVVLQHDDLSRLVAKGKDVNMQAAAANQELSNSFTKPDGLGKGDSIREVASSRFVNVGKQSAWGTARMSCPPDSPARSLEDDEDDLVDDTTSYCTEGDLCFISNTTAFSNVCSSPSFKTTYGFFDRPNAYSVTHDLVPIFSQSKLSTYSDIVFPSHWYWAGKVPYDSDLDMAWDSKRPELYWRGSTTGGFSRWGGWRHHHRQRFVQKLNAASDEILTLTTLTTNASSATRSAEKSTLESHAHLLNVTFSHVGQCDPGDCSAQRHTFSLAPYAAQHDAWSSKFLLDLDGNAFSGRFQAFLKSRSLVFKFALFREWTSGPSGWLSAWRDYVPLSLSGGEWVEAVRYLAEEEEGIRVAEEMAQRSTEWAEKVLRKEDMEVWFFRLLLEYARVIDDNREKIGFAL